MRGQIPENAGRRATGVAYLLGGQTLRADASGGVILSAGSIASPQLLQQAIAANDQTGIQRGISLLDSSTAQFSLVESENAAREQTLQKYFSDKLFAPNTQISLLDPASPDKRGQAIAVVFNGTPGGSE